MWQFLLYKPLLNVLIFFYLVLGNNFGLAIILLTVLIRLALLSVTRKTLSSAQKMKELQPELIKLKEKHKDDKQAFGQAQLELYKKHQINPAAGCLPQIVQFVILIALYQVFNQVLRADGEIVNNLQPLLYGPLKDRLTSPFNLKFLYLNLDKPDMFSLPFTIDLKIFKIASFPGFFLIGAAATQFFSSKMMMKTQKGLAVQAKQTPGQQDDLAVSMQTQMIYLFPLMTLVFGVSFPSGLVLYWLTFSLLMLVTQALMKKR